MQIDGSCHCGRIAYRAEVDAESAYVCHCSDCQAISGSPYRWAVAVPAEKFELLRGEPKAYERTGESGRKNHQMFCPDCASPIHSVTPGAEPAVCRLRLGTARQRDLLKPTAQYWCRSAQDWAINLPDSLCVERQ